MIKNVPFVKIIPLACLALLCALVVSVLFNYQSTKAIGHYQNHELADHALTYVKNPREWGGNACRDIGRSDNGQCKSFVNCIVHAVSGRSQWPAPGYHEGFQRAGGIEIARNSVVRGDIIQITSGMLHTAIVNRVYGNGSFEVIDSNWNLDERVIAHDWTPPAAARFWRLGRTAPAEKPIIGKLDEIRRAPGGIRARGWAIDQDTSNAINVHLYSGNGEAIPTNPAKNTLANIQRSDIGTAYPQYGPRHGFEDTVRAREAGNQRICAYGINAPGTPGTFAQLGCKNIVVSPDPYGNVDSITRVSGGVRVRGWTIDPDTASPIKVHIYGNTGAPTPATNPGKEATANVARPDVARHYPDYGERHGFDTIFPISSKTQTVCVYGINNAPNTHNPQIGCKRV